MSIQEAIAIIKNTIDPIAAIEMAGVWTNKDFASEIESYKSLEEPEEGAQEYLALIYSMKANQALRAFLKPDAVYDVVYDAIA